MKHNVFLVLAFIASALFLSCQKAQTVSAEERNLNLLSPSGKTIATDILELKKKAGNVIVKIHGKKQPFEITLIRHVPVKKGYAAIITYRLDEGGFGSYLIASGVKLRLLSSGVTLNGNASRMEEVIITCVKTPQCETICQLTSVEVNEEEGELEVDCGCGGNCTPQQA